MKFLKWLTNLKKTKATKSALKQSKCNHSYQWAGEEYYRTEIHQRYVCQNCNSQKEEYLSY